MSEIVIQISDMDAQSPRLKALILDRIGLGVAGAVWTPTDFLDLGGRDAVDKTLQRLVKWGELRRIDRGLYDKPQFNSLIETHHYLGYTQPVGEHLKYLVFARGQPIACMAFSSAARHLGSRDRFIGWDKQARLKNIALLAYNSRFLILPWVTVPHLASHILGRMARTLSADWQRIYAHPIHFVETFVDPQRFRGNILVEGLPPWGEFDLLGELGRGAEFELENL